MHRECEQCGGPIPDHKRTNAMFCSRACIGAYFRGLEKAAQLEARQARPPCAECGAPIGLEKQLGTRFCSSACQNRAYNRSRPTPARGCAWCGARFTSRDPRQRFCSKSCATRAQHSARVPPDRWARIVEARRQHPEASDRAIGRMLGVSHHTVARAARAQPAANPRCGGGG